MKSDQSTLDLFVKRPKIVEGEYLSEVEKPSKMEKVEANEECSTLRRLETEDWNLCCKMLED